MFEPCAPTQLRVSDWCFEHNTGPEKTSFKSENFPSVNDMKIDEVKFNRCDFEGDFETKIIFKNCIFDLCDFGLSTFVSTKFTNCTFIRCSFSQCTLKNCEFRDCNYQRIHFSGNETEIPGTMINKPSDFVFGGEAFTDHLPEGVSARYQRFRFLETRSNFSRSLLANLQLEGSEDTYYDCVKTATICEDKARIGKSWQLFDSAMDFKTKKRYLDRSLGVVSGLSGVLSAWVSLQVLRGIGWLNGWGSNISRVLLFGFLLISFLAVAYNCFYKIGWIDSYVKSMEIFFLFGYTNYSEFGRQDFYMVFLNAMFGVSWFAVAIPTIVNRLTRARG